MSFTKTLNSAGKSLDKVLSGTHCKLCCCVLLVGLLLFILNRYVHRNEHFFGLGNMASKADNEYRRVKLKYGRKKIMRMGLNPENYSEDFIFALQIKLTEVNVNFKTFFNLLDSDHAAHAFGGNKATSVKDLQKDTSLTPNTPVNYTLLKTTNLDITYCLISIIYAPSNRNIDGYNDVEKLYGERENLLVVMEFVTEPPAPLQLHGKNFPNIRGMNHPTNNCFDNIHSKILNIGDPNKTTKNPCTQRDLKKLLSQKTLGTTIKPKIIKIVKSKGKGTDNTLVEYQNNVGTLVDSPPDIYNIKNSVKEISILKLIGQGGSLMGSDNEGKYWGTLTYLIELTDSTHAAKTAKKMFETNDQVAVLEIIAGFGAQTKETNTRQTEGGSSTSATSSGAAGSTSATSSGVADHRDHRDVASMAVYLGQISRDNVLKYIPIHNMKYGPKKKELSRRETEINIFKKELHRYGVSLDGMGTFKHKDELQTHYKTLLAKLDKIEKANKASINKMEREEILSALSRGDVVTRLRD